MPGGSHSQPLCLCPGVYVGAAGVSLTAYGEVGTTCHDSPDSELEVMAVSARVGGPGVSPGAMGSIQALRGQC